MNVLALLSAIGRPSVGHLSAFILKMGLVFYLVSSWKSCLANYSLVMQSAPRSNAVLADLPRKWKTRVSLRRHLVGLRWTNLFMNWLGSLTLCNLQKSFLQIFSSPSPRQSIFSHFALNYISNKNQNQILTLLRKKKNAQIADLVVGGKICRRNGRHLVGEKVQENPTFPCGY